MFAGLKRRLGLVEVSTSPTYIEVEGISTLMLSKDMYRVWGNNTVFKYMFSRITSSSLKMRHFFGPDFLYICQKLYEDKQSRTPKRVLFKIIEELKEKTWIGNLDRAIVPITDMSVIDKVAPFPLKPFQREFVELFGKMVPAFRLKGYMLDAGAGSGKTVADLVLATALHASKVIIVTPKPTAEPVWKDTIEQILLTKRPYWVSTQNAAPKVDDHYFICHYEALGGMIDFVKANSKDFANTFVILDESHNFNRIASDRAQLFIELCQMKAVSYCLWASGTPILALGIECIPFLKCIDPLFDAESEERFRKIYGRDAKRANDILRNRIGHLKFHVPKQDVVKTVVTEHTINVKMPDGDKYTLENIGLLLRKFIDDRNVYYEKNRKHYEGKYYEGLKIFEATLRNDSDRRQFKAYQAAIKIISSGFDPKTMKEEAMLANNYERKQILPVLSGAMKAEFRSAKSVVKYLPLKIMGEALGTIIGGMRSKCHLDMIAHIDFEQYIDGAKKKTLIFTSWVEVLEGVAEKVFHEGYTPARIYGATNKDLPAIVGKFYKDEDLNPMIATYQSLSTGVPLTVANRILLLNQPFRDAIKVQTIARAARLGQDSDVDVFNFLLDTGTVPNISTRSNDILQWSQEQVASILSVKNVDMDTLTLESKMTDPLSSALTFAEMDLGQYSGESFDFLKGLAQLFADIVGISHDMESSGHSGQGWGGEKYYRESNGFEVPTYLYHGSAFKQGELMPGYLRSGEIVQWDGTESNEWLYTSTDRETAIMLGISSSLEKQYRLDRYHYDERTKKIVIETPDEITLSDLYKLPVFLYTIKGEEEDEWMPNYNKVNNITTEYKTQAIVSEHLVKVEAIDVHRVLSRMKVEIKHVH